VGAVRPGDPDDLRQAIRELAESFEFTGETLVGGRVFRHGIVGCPAGETGGWMPEK